MATAVKDYAPLLEGEQEWADAIERMRVKKTPSFFHMTAPLPKQGRTNQMLGATDHMHIVLKTYASGGENEIHAHPGEDHVFVVLHGKAEFHGPRGERREVGKHDCVLLPAGSLYSFVATGDEHLVMLRIGAATDPENVDRLSRIDADGKPFGGHDVRNKEVELILEDGRYFE